MSDPNRIRTCQGVISLAVVLLSAQGCNPSPASAETDPTKSVAPNGEAASAGCRMDTDCKGDRVCERGSCRTPRGARTASPPAQTAQPAKTTQPVRTTQPVQPARTAQPAQPTVRYLTYANPRFGFRISYPDLYEASNESDNGDGVTFLGQQAGQSLRIWGQNAIADINASGFDLYEAAKKSHTLRQSFANHNFCAVAYPASSGLETHETCFIADAVTRCFAMTYTATARNTHKPMIRRMTRELTNSQYNGTEGDR